MIISTYKVLLHDYSQPLNMLFHPTFNDLESLQGSSLEIEFLYINLNSLFQKNLQNGQVKHLLKGKLNGRKAH